MASVGVRHQVRDAMFYFLGAALMVSLAAVLVVTSWSRAVGAVLAGTATVLLAAGAAYGRASVRTRRWLAIGTLALLSVLAAVAVATLIYAELLTSDTGLLQVQLTVVVTDHAAVWVA